MLLLIWFLKGKFERFFSEKLLYFRSLFYERVFIGNFGFVWRISEDNIWGFLVLFLFLYGRDWFGSFCLFCLRSNSDVVILEENLLFELMEIKKLKLDECDFNKKGVVWISDGCLVIINFGND